MQHSSASPSSGSSAQANGLAHRTLGHGGPAVSAIGLGCMGMTGFYGAADEQESIRTLRRALELGCNFWDTSDAYGPQTNEQLLSHIAREHRQDVFLATKFGISIHPQTLQRSVNCTPANVRRSCEASLRRLGVEWIDLYYPHRVDPATPIEETVGAMADLVREGKVRYLGLSEPGAETIRRAQKVFPITTVQIEYSLWSRGVEAEILPVLRELGIGLVAYAPLGHGFLTGHYRSRQDLADNDFRRTQPRFAEENLTHNLQLVDGIDALASERGLSAAQFALAWVLHQGTDIVPIVGTKRVKYLEEDLVAAEVQLSPADLVRVNEAVRAPAGERYDPGGMRSVGI